MKRSNMFKALSLFLAFTLAVSPVSAMAAEQSITDDAVIEESFEEQSEETGSAESTVEETTFDEVVEAPVQESEEAEESLDAQGEEETDHDAQISFTKSAGYANGAYAEWTPVSAAAGYKAYVKEKTASSWTALDDPLIRKYKDYWRVDAMGLKAGTYQIKVEGYAADKTTLVAQGVTGDLTVDTHDRHGFAFTDVKTPGAYNMDGTLKDNAIVLYVDNSNFNTIELEVIKNAKGEKITFIGVQQIVNNDGYFKYAKFNDNKPLDIRVIGLVNTSGFPSGSWGSSSEGLQVKGDGKVETPLTIEGVGRDATIHGFGILCRDTRYVELSNLAIMCFADDAVSLDTGNLYTWVHNIDLFYGSTGGDSDQAKGDGSVDVKGNSQYQTYSYNHFWDSGKASLCGMKDESGENYITYHHNWFDHSDSRHPRIRTMSVHVYNNFYDGNSKYGVGAAEKSEAFVESNYFKDVKFPMLSSMQGSDLAANGTTLNKDNGTFSGENGGVIKAYNNQFKGNYVTFIPYACSEYILNGNKVSYAISGASSIKHYDAYVVGNRNTLVPEQVKAYQGGKTYSNFDTKVDLGVTEADIDEPEDVPAKVMHSAGRVNGGDIWWNFDDTDKAYESYAVDSQLKTMLVGYRTTLVSIGGFSGKEVAAGIQDTSRVITPDDEKTALARTLTDGYKDKVTISSTVTSIQTYVDEDAFDAAEFLDKMGYKSAPAASAQLTENGTLKDTIDYGSFSVYKGYAVKDKLDQIALKKSDGTFIIKADEGTEKKTIKIGVRTDGKTKTSYCGLYNASNQRVGDIQTVAPTGATLLYKDLDPGVYTLKYEKLDETNWLRVESASICKATTVDLETGGQSQEDTTEYTVVVNNGEGVTTDYAGGSYRKGTRVEFSASVPDGYTLDVKAVKASGASIYVSDLGDGNYSFSMPSSAVTLSLTAKENVDEPDDPIVDPVNIYTVRFYNKDSVSRVEVEENGFIPFDSIPETGEGFVCWSKTETEAGMVDLNTLVVTEDLDLTAIYKSQAEVRSVDEEFVSEEFISYFSTNYQKLDSNLYTPTAEYNPITYGSFTLKDWKKPSGSKLNRIALLSDKMDTSGIEFNAPAAADFTITGTTGKNSVESESYFVITDEYGNKYEASDSDGNVNEFIGGVDKLSNAKTLSFKLGAEGRYKLTYDKTRMAGAGDKAQELRVFKLTLKGKYDDADPSHVVTFKQGEEELDRIQVLHGAFLPENALPTPSISSNEIFLGWSTSLDEADIVESDEDDIHLLSSMNVMEDMTLYALTEVLPDENHTVVFKVSDNSIVKTIPDGYKITEYVPTVTAPFGYKFKGWKTEAGVDVDVDTYVVEGDVVINAVFEKKQTGGEASSSSVIYDLCSATSKGKLSGIFSGVTVSSKEGSSAEYASEQLEAIKSSTTQGTVKDGKISYTDKFPIKNTEISFELAGAKSNLILICDSDSSKEMTVKLSGEDGTEVTNGNTGGIVTFSDVKAGRYTISKGNKDCKAYGLIVLVKGGKDYYKVTTNVDESVETSLVDGNYAPDEIRFTAIPRTGFKNLVVSINGIPKDPDEENIYSFTLSENTVVDMTAEKDTSTKHNIGVRVKHASLKGLSAGKYSSGDKKQFTVAPVKGYRNAIVTIKKALDGSDVTADVLTDNEGVYELTVPEYDIVLELLAEEIPVESVSANKLSVTLAPGESETVRASVKPAEASAVIEWHSLSENVATVRSGLITATGLGTTTVTASAGGKSVDIAVEVKDRPIDSVVLSDSTLDVGIGETKALSLTINPANATVDKTVTWEITAGTDYITLDRGRITGVKEGTATVKATAGGKSDTCTVSVHPIAASEIVLNKETMTLQEGGTGTLKAAVLPANTTDKTVTWTTSKSSVATVENGVVTAVAEGKATITATCGSASKSCEVTVAKKVIAVQSVTISPAGNFELRVGDTKTLTATVLPDNATDKRVTWSSSAPAVATVKDGVVTAVAAGSAEICAASGEAEAKVTVTVTAQGSGSNDPVPTPTPEDPTLPKVQGTITVGGVTYEVALPVSLQFTGKAIKPSDKVLINGKKVKESISSNVVFSKVSFKKNKKPGQADVVITLKAAKGVKDRALKKEIKNLNKSLKKNPFHFTVAPRDLSTLTVEGKLIYKASKGKWTSKLKAGNTDVKKRKLKLNKKETKTDFVVDAAYDGAAATVKIEGRNLFTGTAVVPVEIKQ